MIRLYVCLIWPISGFCNPDGNYGQEPTAPSRPNIVHIIADDLGWNDVGFHGSEIRTPNIDRLASESVVLDRFYVTPICSPTRAGALTGRYPFRFGIWDRVVSPTQRHGLPPSERTLPEILADAGYDDRALLGKWHLGLASTMFHPLNHGFTHFYGHYNGAIDYFSHRRFGQNDWHRGYDSVFEEGYSTDLIGREAARFIEKNANGSSPFYLLVAFNAPHSPIQARESDLDGLGFDPNGKRAPNTDAGIAKRENAPDYGERGKGNSVRQTYSAMVAALDRNLKLILDELDDRGIRDNTIVVFHSDNGGVPKHGGNNKPLRGKKHTTWEGGVRVVATLGWPKKLKPGKYDSVVSYVDILPTLVAAVGLTPADNLDGIDLMPFLTGKEKITDRCILLGEKTVVSDEWKLKDGLFFDMKNDPYETKTVINPPKVIAEKLHTELARFKSMRGTPTRSRLNKPAAWPPGNWKLPIEEKGLRK